MAIGWQVIIRLLDHRVIAPTPATRRVFADVALRVSRSRRVYVFEAADTHAHFAAHCDKEQARRLAHDLRLALPPALGHPVRFEPPKLVEIKDHWHLDSMLGYVLGQKEHHGVGGDRLRETSNLPDLLGYRVIGAWTATLLREILPRVDRTRLLGLLGIDTLEEGWDLDLLPEAAASAAGLPDLGARTPRHVEARAAAARVAREAGCRTVLIAECLGVSARGVRALLARPHRPALDHAIRLQLDLRRRFGEEDTAFVREPVSAYEA